MTGELKETGAGRQHETFQELLSVNEETKCFIRRTLPAVLRIAASFPAALAGRRLRRIGGDGALVDDLHAGTAVLSGPPAAGGETAFD